MGLFLMVGYSRREEKLLRPTTNGGAIDAILPLQIMVSTLSSQMGVCTFLYYKGFIIPVLAYSTFSNSLFNYCFLIFAFAVICVYPSCWAPCKKKRNRIVNDDEVGCFLYLWPFFCRWKLTKPHSKAQFFILNNTHCEWLLCWQEVCRLEVFQQTSDNMVLQVRLHRMAGVPGQNYTRYMLREEVVRTLSHSMSLSSFISRLLLFILLSCLSIPMSCKQNNGFYWRKISSYGLLCTLFRYSAIQYSTLLYQFRKILIYHE